MNIRHISKLTKQILPPSLFKIVRIAGSAILTPLLFSYRTGHFRSALMGKSVDKFGKPIPWYTYPAIEFLTHKDFKEKRILEWGAGQSTFWWASRAKEIIAFESDPFWHAVIGRSSLPNVTLLLTSNDALNCDQYLLGKKFDVIIIDGLNRFQCAIQSVDLLVKNGVIILDDSEGFWGEENGKYPILDLFRERGFQRVDFFGNAPGVIEPHCTSLFFRGTCFLFTGQENPARRLI